MSDNRKLAVVILAAGKGKRMKSDLPKVLHPLCGRPVVAYVLEEVMKLEPGKVVMVVGHGAEDVRGVIGAGPDYVLQAEQKGTGHALMVALEAIEDGYDEVLALPGDSPLVTGETLARLVGARREGAATASLLSTVLEDPFGYGRIVRAGDDSVARIAEEADATDVEKAIEEVNACTYCFERETLTPALDALTTDNAQGEYYLTGVVEWLVGKDLKVMPVPAPAEEALGINSREQLAEAEGVMRRRINARLMQSGVTMTDPARTYIDHGIEVGPDTVIMPLVFLTGSTRIGGGCRIGPCSSVNESSIGDGCVVEFSWLDGAELAENVSVGPYSRLRPGCRIGPSAKVGSFVEMKKTVVGRGSKVPHLSYIGDAVIGEDANVGAGSITCNYDGEDKHPTEIGDRAFIGSDTMMIAPVRIGEDSVTGAGSAIYEDVPDGSLGIERGKQKNVSGYGTRKKNREGPTKG